MADGAIAVVGLPSKGLRKLVECFDIRHLEDAEIARVCDNPSESRDFPPASVAGRLQKCFDASENYKKLIIYQTPWGFLERQTGKAAPVGRTQTQLESFARNTLALWEAFHISVLALHREQQDRCLLINGDRPVEASTVARLVAERFGLRLTARSNPPAIDSHAAAPHEDAWCQIVDKLAPECADLYVELESCAEMMGRQPELEFGEFARRDAQHMVGMLQLLACHSRIEAALWRLGIEPRDVESVEEKLIARAREAERNELQIHQFEQLRDKAAAADGQIESLKLENELYQLQLHQLQDELRHQLELGRQNKQRLSELQRRLDQQIEAAGKKDQKTVWSQKSGQFAPVVGKLVRKIFPAKTSAPGRNKASTGPGRNSAGKELDVDVLQQQVTKIRSSGLFDEKWYLRTYPDVARMGIDPIKHYLKFGAAGGRNPSATFDTYWYLHEHSDVAAAKMNPLLHYIQHGKSEGRRTMGFTA
jgi:hypothetical protein